MEDLAKSRSSCSQPQTEPTFLQGALSLSKKRREEKREPAAIPKWSCLPWNGKLSHLSCSFGLSSCRICCFICSISFPTFFSRLSNIKFELSTVTSAVPQRPGLLVFGRGGLMLSSNILTPVGHMEILMEKIIFKHPQTGSHLPSLFPNNSCCSNLEVIRGSFMLQGILSSISMLFPFHQAFREVLGG